jgi:hypothetical protein
MNILVKGKFINAEIISRAKDDNPVLPSVLRIKSPVLYDVDMPNTVEKI